MSNTDNYYAQSDHPEPHLVDNEMSYDQLMGEPGENHGQSDTNDGPSLQTTETDYMFGYMANRDKLVSEDKRHQFQRGALDTVQEEGTDEPEEATEHHTEEENLQSFMNATDQNETFVPQQQPPAFDHHTVEGGTAGFQAHPQHPSGEAADPYAHLPPEQIKLMKLDMLRKLLELKNYGVTLSKNYSMEDDLRTMQYEHDLHHNIRAKQNGVQWMSNALLMTIQGLEMVNDNYNPFKFNLSGWSQSMQMEMRSYYDVLGELYEKYNQPGSDTSPEVKLMMFIGGSALKFHLMNHAVSNTLDKDMTKELREKAVKEKVIEATREDHEALHQSSQAQHQTVAQNTADLEMLRMKQTEMNRVQKEKQILEKQSEIEKLQQQIDIISQQSGMSQPQVPARMQGRLPPTGLSPEGQLQAMQYQQMINNRFAELSPQQQHAFLRNQQIKQQKMRMQEEERMKKQMEETSRNQQMYQHMQTMKDIKMGSKGQLNVDSAQTGDIEEDVDDILSKHKSEISSEITSSASGLSSKSSGSRVRIKRSRAGRKKKGVKISSNDSN